MSLAPAAAGRAMRATGLLAVAALPLPLAAQHVVGADVNAATETRDERQPLFFGSAGLLPAGRWGVSVQGTRTRLEARYPSVEQPDGARIRADATAAMGSLAWGPTAWLTLGGYAVRVDESIERTPALTAPAPPTDPAGPPTRQGTRTGIGANEVGLHARVSIWQSAGGATRVTATGRLRDRADEAVSSTAGLAMQQRSGRATLHVAPSLRFTDGSSSALEIDAAVALALGARLGLTGEVLYFRNPGAYDESATELAAGLRYRLGRLAFDAGIRHLAAAQTIGGTDHLSRNSALLATHWMF